MKQLKLTQNEKINLLKYGHIEIERGIFTIIITVDEYGDYDIHVLNPYDPAKLKDEMFTHLIKFLNGKVNQAN